MPPYKVLVVEDEPIIRKNIVDKVSRVGDAFFVCAETASGREAWELVRQLRPHVVLIDINVPEMDGLTLARNIRHRYPKMIAIIISGYSSFEYAKQAVGYGAFEYLLKPVKQETLSEVFAKVKLQLDVTALGNARDIVLVGGEEGAALLPFQLPGKLNVMQICVGNLASPFPDETQRQLHETLWARLDLPRRIADSRPGQEPLWLVDEALANEKLLLFSALPGDQLGAFADSLCAAATEAIAPYPVHIAKSDVGVPYEDIWVQANLLRSFSEKRFVAGVSEVADAGQPAPAPASSLGQDAMLRLYVLLCGNMEAFYEELVLLMEKWIKACRPQREIEAQYARFVHFVLSQSSTAESRHAKDIEGELALAAALAPNPASWAREASEIFASLVRGESFHGAEGIALQVRDFLDHSPALSLTMEEIARHFAFSQTYLTKIFKRHCGVTPVKYLTALRIDRAKQLFRQHPDLDIQEVAQSVGYDDPHYFSRLFKQVTALSPSEYKAACSGPPAKNKDQSPE